MQKFLNSATNLYCCFVDLSRAFDNIDRNALWFKLQQAGISCKIINLVKNMYSKIKLCVRETCNQMMSRGNGNESNDMLGDDADNPIFTSFSGVFQGECLSPFLFSMFVNDLSDFLADVNDVGIYLNEIVVTALLFADDMIIFREEFITRLTLCKA